MDERLFFVAPDRVNVMAAYDGQTSTWTVKSSTSRRDQHGEPQVVPGDVYEYLTADEARTIVESVISGALGLA